jgi:hypothetical protein
MEERYGKLYVNGRRVGQMDTVRSSYPARLWHVEQTVVISRAAAEGEQQLSTPPLPLLLSAYLVAVALSTDLSLD